MNPIIIGFLLLSGMYFEMTVDLDQVVPEANNEFSFKIFKMLSKDENDVMSSLSILSAFTILMNGAKGQTFDDMKQFLEFENSKKGLTPQNINDGFQRVAEKYQSKEIEEKTEVLHRWQLKHQLNMANRVIYSTKTKLLPEFERSVGQHFKGEIQTADFQKNNIEETNKINDWVRNKTNNKIQKIFDKLEKDTSIVILNVLYFKGDWKIEFSESSTKKLDFYNNGVTAVQIDTMSKQNMFNYALSSELDSQVLEMDYLGNEISFVIVLPKERNGLKALKEKINAQNFNDALKSMEQTYTKVFIPKFKVESSYDLMKEIDPKPIALTSSADLSGMTPEKTIVSQVKHKVFIAIDENGTEAAAVTAISAVFKSGYYPQKSVEFKADHPFLFFIRDKTNSMILFSGQINKL